MVNFKNVMSLSLALSLILSTSQAEAMKRKWEEAFPTQAQEVNTSSRKLAAIDAHQEAVILVHEYFGQGDFSFEPEAYSSQNAHQKLDDNSNRRERLLEKALF